MRTAPAAHSPLPSSQSLQAKQIAAQQALETQRTENNMVQNELAADPGAVYKLSGRVLVKQDLGEARTTVARRLEFIQAEMCVEGGRGRACGQ